MKHRRLEKYGIEWNKYECPHCGGVALDGDPERGSYSRGGATCQNCDKSFSVVRKKPVGVFSLEEMSFKEWVNDTAL
jgi:transcription elongation factor Elf1